ncbi:MAG: helix-turn-helix domain-containing protein [Patescibacteria group bacterium]|nr:helix-turn-helix domain-containing protein [Patescibacteria group bacterium]
MKEFLRQFNLRRIEIELFEKLFFEGEMTASTLAKKVNISRTSVYDLLEKMIDKGLIFESPKAGVNQYAVKNPEKLNILLSEKEKEFEKARKSFKSLEKLYKNDSIKEPSLQIYHGQSALQQMMKDMLLYRDIKVRAYWPIMKMIKILGKSFLIKFHQERIARNISLKTIWPASQIPSIKKYPFLGIDKENKRKVKIAPKSVNFSLGYVIYGSTVRFLSSSKENYGFLIESEELSKMMKGQFDIVWQQAKNYPSKVKDQVFKITKE